MTVFALLDAFYQKEPSATAVVSAIAAAGLPFIGLGIMLEAED